ncbi:hypothetical protein L915_21859 [Phytophthora nicotianae]|uniref:Uncharacterized protein n=1 Tax=Phytophthora nicotianae TaxID=4792 RepID=W2FJ39_PHYNI|nr:hypothetical protein L915_21859 [Phytophthora nicotianae]
MGHWFVFQKVWNDVSGLWSSRLTFEGYEVEAFRGREVAIPV